MPKHLKLTLDTEDEDPITIGLLRLVTSLPFYQFFFHLNRVNHFHFRRINDFMFKGNYFDYYFPQYETYDKDQKTCFQIIANKSFASVQTKPILELFTGEENHRHLISKYPDVDYIFKTSDAIADFSLILLPENIAFPIQPYLLEPENELFLSLLYYE